MDDGGGAHARMNCTLMGAPPFLSAPKTWICCSIPLVMLAHLNHPLDFIWALQFGFGLDHLVGLVPDISLAAHP